MFFMTTDNSFEKFIVNYKPFGENYYNLGRDSVNRCFSKDLNIIFPKSVEQIEEYKDTIARYEKLLKIDKTSREGQNKSYYYDHLDLIEFWGPKVKEILKPEQLLQYLISITDRKNLRFDAFIGCDPISHLKKVVNGTKMYSNLGLCALIDKNGYMKNFIRDFYHQKENPIDCVINLFFTSFTEKLVDEKLITRMISFQNGTPILSSCYVSRRTFYEYYYNMETLDEKITSKYFASNYEDMYQERVKEILSDNYNKVVDKSDILSLRESNTPQWLRFDGMKLPGYNIPSLREICFAVLREMFLIDRKSAIEKVISLNYDILYDFIVSSSRERTPVGLDMIQSIVSQKSVNYHEILPLVIDAASNHESYFRYVYFYHVPQNIFFPMHNNNFAINVYENYDRFMLHSNLPDSLKETIILEQQLDFSFEGHSVVPKDKFLEIFHRETDQLFKNNWVPGMIVHGGIITKCLLGGDGLDSFDRADVDISFILGNLENFSTSNEYANSILGQIFGSVEIIEKEYTIIKEGASRVTITKHYPNKMFQVSFNIYLSVEELLLGSDVDSSCFAFDGKNVFTLERGLIAMNYRVNVAKLSNCDIRGMDQYCLRLNKYYNRGFGIILKKNEWEYFMKINNNPTNLVSDNGIGYLYALKDEDLRYYELKAYNEGTLPYGPKWDSKTFKESITQYFTDNYNGYNGDDIPFIQENIIDIGLSFKSEPPTQESYSFQEQKWYKLIEN